jgi:hypothetical protein
MYNETGMALWWGLPIPTVHMFHDLKINYKGVDLTLKSKTAQLHKSPLHTVDSDNDQLSNMYLSSSISQAQHGNAEMPRDLPGGSQPM